MKNKSTNSSPAPIHTLRHTERTPSGIRRTQRPLCVGGKCLSGRRVRHHVRVDAPERNRRLPC